DELVEVGELLLGRVALLALAGGGRAAPARQQHRGGAHHEQTTSHGYLSRVAGGKEYAVCARRDVLRTTTRIGERGEGSRRSWASGIRKCWRQWLFGPGHAAVPEHPVHLPHLNGPGEVGQGHFRGATEGPCPLPQRPRCITSCSC